MTSIINYIVIFLFTALLPFINNFLKKCHHLMHHFFFKLLTKETKLVLYWIILRVILLGLALLYRHYPRTLENTLAHFWLLLCCSCFYFYVYFCYWKLYLFIYVNSYVRNKVDLTWLASEEINKSKTVRNC